MDGHASGALVKMFNPECELIGINYGDTFPWGDAIGNTVFMVDFSLQPFYKMLRLNEQCDLVWIDHHKTAIEDYHNECDKDGIVIKGIQEEGLGACALVWRYFRGDDPPPTFIKLLAEYDVWRFEDPRTLPFQYGLRMYKTYPVYNMELWENLFDEEFINKIINEGSLILKYRKEEDEKYVKACSFELEFKGLKCIAVNKMLTNSMIFDSVWDNSKYDAMLTFGYRKGKWTVSLYTDKEGIDVSEIAHEMGGGGHKQAAGFQLDDISEIIGDKDVENHTSKYEPFLPKKYNPSIGEKSDKRELMYGIGIRRSGVEFGMINGPNPYLQSMLDIVGGPDQYIIRFNADFTEDILYKWSEDGYWRRV